MLLYAASYDGNLLLTEELKEQIFTPMISNDGKTLPYGLGWFIQQKEGIKLTRTTGIGRHVLLRSSGTKKIVFRPDGE
jgi:hypothetical protein